MTRDFTAMTDAPTEEAYFAQSTEIIPEAIREEFVRLPADLAFWGERYAEAIKTYLVAEQDRKTTYARTRLLIRGTATVKLTEADVDAHIEADPGYQTAKMSEIEAEAAKMAAKVRLDAVSTKRDMLMSLGAYIRAEMSPTQLNR